MSNQHNEFLSHFQSPTEALVEYARDTVFLHSRYLFVWRVGKVPMAYCTHCHEEYPLGVGQASYKHNEKTTCLNCQSECKVKQSGRGRSHFIDDAYVVWYDKSVVNPKAVVATWYLAWRDYSGDYRNVETQFAPRARYYFEPGKGGQMLKETYDGWRMMRHVAPLPTSWSYWTRKEVYFSTENVEKAVSGTQLQYSMWQAYQDRDTYLLDYFDLASKYGCVEYLSKLGLKKLVLAKLNGAKTYKAVNWRGKTIEKVLRMPLSDIRQLKQVANHVEPLSLYSYHYWRKRDWNVSVTDAHVLRRFTESGGYYSKMLKEQEQYGTEMEIIKYLLKQSRLPDAPKTYSDATYVLTEWRDYLRSAKELGMDLKPYHVDFPNNLHEAHDKAIRKVKIKQDELINQRIAARIPDLERFAYQDEQFLIRPAQSSLELFEEGKALNHCVGGYSDRYAAGSTDLFVLRRVSEPDTPLCTVEVTQGKIRQARGFKNRVPDDQEQAFLDLFEQNLRSVIRREKRAKKIAEIRQKAG
ncbi:PcfJ domain-containing protein [Alicyclobacillus tolerans]|uniref:PcfJ domain-containing protein n=1 Tax=Alicyclobacillus tolerans TaxID=90970 RepID=UPI001F2F5EA1|nr:PcfJ domain-containing protein [Alicyclobacillus tolerans]MCF8568030.1 PcfJ domain-containing protein [Alicyclobacillus tolerans]